MTTDEAKANIGKAFKWLGGGYWWDTIKDVNEDGWIIGNFFEAPAEDCRLKQEQPQGLKKYLHENKKTKLPDDRNL